MASHSRAQKKRICRQVSPLPRSLAQALLPAPGWSIQADASTTEKHRALRGAHDSEGKIKRRPFQKTFSTLPDDVLLELFTFYVDDAEHVDEWHTLIHVCRRWRAIVFASQHRLNLQLLCTSRSPVKEMLDVWPVLPIIISDFYGMEEGTNNIIAALEHNDLVREINLQDVPNLLLEGFATLSPEPFPVLTLLRLRSTHESPPVLPASFLGASAPRLRHLDFDGIPFPEVWGLLLSTHDLVTLELWNMPHSGYISPEAMATCLATMINLSTLRLGFRSPRSCPNRARRRPPPLSRLTLPALTLLEFKGVSEYLEDLVSRVDAPLLHMVDILFFNQLILDTPQLSQFIGRLGRFKALSQADIISYENIFQVALPNAMSVRVGEGTKLALGIACSEPDWQPSSLAQICSLSFPPLSALERLTIYEYRHPRPHWPNYMEYTQWLELLEPFTAVKELYLSETIAQCVAAALEELPEERLTGVMPALQKVFIYAPRPTRSVKEAFQQFVTARKLVGHSIDVCHWEGGWVATVSGGDQ